MQAYRDRGAAEGDAGMQAKADETYSAGDINTSLIQTARGRTVMLQHDVVSPRPCAQPTHPASKRLVHYLSCGGCHRHAAQPGLRHAGCLR